MDGAGVEEGGNLQRVAGASQAARDGAIGVACLPPPKKRGRFFGGGYAVPMQLIMGP